MRRPTEGVKRDFATLFAKQICRTLDDVPRNAHPRFCNSKEIAFLKGVKARISVDVLASLRISLEEKKTAEKAGVYHPPRFRRHAIIWLADHADVAMAIAIAAQKKPGKELPLLTRDMIASYQEVGLLPAKPIALKACEALKNAFRRDSVHHENRRKIEKETLCAGI